MPRLFYLLYVPTALLFLGVTYALVTHEYWSIYLYILTALFGAILTLLTPGYWNIPVGVLVLILLVLTSPERRSPAKPTEVPVTEAPIVIRPDLTPEAMKACAEAFVRYGFWDVRDYECRVERGSKGAVVALYGPGADGKAGEKKRLGEVPLGRGR
jgi:hypothetical protein